MDKRRIRAMDASSLAWPADAPDVKMPDGDQRSRWIKRDESEMEMGWDGDGWCRARRRMDRIEHDARVDGSRVATTLNMERQETITKKKSDGQRTR